MGAALYTSIDAAGQPGAALSRTASAVIRPRKTSILLKKYKRLREGRLDQPLNLRMALASDVAAAA